MEAELGSEAAAQRASCEIAATREENNRTLK